MLNPRGSLPHNTLQQGQATEVFGAGHLSEALASKLLGW